MIVRGAPGPTGHLTGLTHWGRVMHICVVKLTIIGSDNGLSPGRRQAIIWTNAGILLIGPLGTNFSEIWIGIQAFSFTKMHLKMSSAKWRPFCLGLNVLSVFIGVLIWLSVCSTSVVGVLMGVDWALNGPLLWWAWHRLAPVETTTGGYSASFLPLTNSAVFSNMKTLAVCWILHSYLTGVTAAQLRSHLTNVNVI